MRNGVPVAIKPPFAIVFTQAPVRKRGDKNGVERPFVRRYHLSPKRAPCESLPRPPLSGAFRFFATGGGPGGAWNAAASWLACGLLGGAAAKSRWIAD
jgi:hypothetical protein